jgi:hypothetical protein
MIASDVRAPRRLQPKVYIIKMLIWKVQKGVRHRAAALASEASGQRGISRVRAPDTRPEPGSSARDAHDRRWE